MTTVMTTIHAAAQAIGATVQGPDAAFSAVVTDSRTIAPGELFVALVGDTFDGHAYVADVVMRGAAGAVVSSEFADAHPYLPLISVSDTRLALGALAAQWRGRFKLPLIGITGSNGKTTVKDMCTSIMQAQFGAKRSGSTGALNLAWGSSTASLTGVLPVSAAVLATEGNLNNHIGLPITLLKLRSTHRVAVIEMGMNHLGEIDYLTRIALPTVALLNNAQRAHLAGMGSLEQVAAAKGEIFSGLAPDGVAIFNADDPHAPLWRDLARSACPDGKQISFGLDQPADVMGRYSAHGFGGALALTTPWGSLELNLGVPGRHNARNACAAAAATLAAGASLDAVARGLAGFVGVKGRLQRCVGRKGSLVVDDSYNANPDSMRAALDVVAAVPGKRIFVMGDMGEAGEAAGQFHDEIGGYAKSHGFDRLLCLGELSLAAAHNFGQGGQHFLRLADLVEVLLGELDAHTTVLVKGSRFMRMERVVDAIREAKS